MLCTGTASMRTGLSRLLHVVLALAIVRTSRASFQ
jgi:hypothetical protein